MTFKLAAGIENAEVVGAGRAIDSFDPANLNELMRRGLDHQSKCIADAEEFLCFYWGVGPSDERRR